VRLRAIVLGIAIAAFARGVAAKPADEARRLGRAFAAYDRGDLDSAARLVRDIDERHVVNRDYVDWLRGMIALRTNHIDDAERAFHDLARRGGTRFGGEVPWRLADCAWARGDRVTAAKQYTRLIQAERADEVGDIGTAMYRIAQASGSPAAYRALVVAHPAHPMAAIAEAKMLALGGPPLTAAEHIARAKQLSTAHLWDEAVAELALVPDGVDGTLAHERDYWLGSTLFDMRRRYADAGKRLLAVYAFLGDRAPEAMFHGARALSRADRDDDAITWYQKLVATFPASPQAAEAQFLSGWLEFNRGKYRAAIAPLEASLAKYPHSKFADDSLWFLAMSHYFSGDLDAARGQLAKLAKRAGSLEGGKGMYWLARVQELVGQKDVAMDGYRATVTAHPFSWYALLARARLAAGGVQIGPFGVDDPKPRGPKLAAEVDEALASDSLIQRADELIAANMGGDAGLELARGEREILARHDKSAAFAMLLDRYRKAGNYNRPWMLAVSYSGNALDGPPQADARRWWENAYPRAYRGLIEKYQGLGSNPEDYLYSIMRKESGFDPHDLSYADAQGLLQMIPATTARVAHELRIAYDPGMLYEPEFNVRAGSWYIGHLLAKFRGQVPIGSGSFNCGPKPVMKWLDQYGDRELDELVELVPYTQTREYMKKVTENYARYRYLYASEIYLQPLSVDKHYVVDDLTY
jgi:soluble lytic murein transglycosylase